MAKTFKKAASMKVLMYFVFYFFLGRALVNLMFDVYPKMRPGIDPDWSYKLRMVTSVIMFVWVGYYLFSGNF